MPPIATRGFRPFFLLASGWAALAVFLWLLALSGRWSPRGPLAGTAWHAHEMVFGFAVAVAAGFLLTAVSNWTGRDTVVGKPLLGLAALWVLGRAGLAVVPGWAGGLFDLAFLPALTFVVARPLIPTKNRRNVMFPVMLGGLWVLDVAVHLSAAGMLPATLAIDGGRAAVQVFVVMTLVMSGRVVPTFTRNATGADGIRIDERLDRVAVAGAVALVPLMVVPAPVVLVSAVAAVTGVATLLRSRSWGSGHTGGQPLLWVLHLGHVWLGLGLLLRAVSPYVGVLPSIATHALTVGGLGLLTLGMMARVALGHTGRPLVVGRAVASGFGLVAAAAVVRVVGPTLAPVWWWGWISAAGALWMMAFAVYVVTYSAVLTGPRADGRP
jgi:uncharacterized protein involved in response to NO